MTTFNHGDLVRNINVRSRYYGMVGTFHHELSWLFWSVGDVEYPGQHGPHGYPFVAQRVSDLRLVRESEAA
jgi:hypothetical protein